METPHGRGVRRYRATPELVRPHAPGRPGRPRLAYSFEAVMNDSSGSNQGSSFSGLPRWPEGAGELPDHRPSGSGTEHYQWLYVFATLGGATGFVFGLRQGLQAEEGSPIAFAIGS